MWGKRMARIAMAKKQCWSSGVVVALLLALAGVVGGAGSVSGVASGVADANVVPMPVPMMTLEPKLIGTSSGPPGHHVLPSRRLTTASVWCVTKSNLSEESLQGALDWVCGTQPSQGQVNCFAVQSGNNCFLPDTVQWHASWAFNVYFQAHNATNDACDFQGTATQVYADPSTATCVFTGSTKEVNATISNGSSMTPPSPGYTNSPGRSAAPAGYEPELLSHLLAAASVVLLMTQLLLT